MGSRAQGGIEAVEFKRGSSVRWLRDQGSKLRLFDFGVSVRSWI